jgi:hypothetical protein
MTAQSFDDAAVREAMGAFVTAADRLDEAATTGADARVLLDLAESKTLAGMRLRKRLAELGWSAPAPAPAPAARRVSV